MHLGESVQSVHFHLVFIGLGCAPIDDLLKHKSVSRLVIGIETEKPLMFKLIIFVIL
jgi:hypothetical protein